MIGFIFGRLKKNYFRVSDEKNPAKWIPPAAYSAFLLKEDLANLNIILYSLQLDQVLCSWELINFLTKSTITQAGVKTNKQSQGSQNSQVGVASVQTGTNYLWHSCTDSRMEEVYSPNSLRTKLAIFDKDCEGKIWRHTCLDILTVSYIVSLQIPWHWKAFQMDRCSLSLTDLQLTK